MKKYIFCAIFVISLALSIFYGTQKAGFHEDEYYTYYSSNRSIGLFQPDREWQDRQTILDEFAVKPGEGFNYGMVWLVQSWDVHPPLYYSLFHTLCSFVPGQFSKWPGLITNFLAFAVAFLFLCLLMERLKVPLPVEVMVLLFWGLNPQTVSSNMLIRMYAWLGAALIACALFHIRLIQDFDNNRMETRDFILKSLLPIMVTSYIGFLIQYFYIFFFVSIGFLAAVWIVFFKKDIRSGLIYVAGCAVSLALAVLTYPAAPRHMFGGYRGGDASGSLFDMANTWMRISFFTGLLNDFVFAGGLLIILIVILLGLLLKITSKKKRSGSESRLPRPEIVILTLASIGYFLLTSKTALLVGSASNRYEMPVYPLLILLILMDAYYVIKNMGNNVVLYALAAILAALLLKGHINDKRVLFLYPEDTEKIEYATENSDKVAVVMFNPKTPQNVWRLTDELLAYPKVFYMDEENLDPVTDPEVAGADSIILYAADNELQEKAFENLFVSCPGVATMERLFTEDMWTAYEVK